MTFYDYTVDDEEEFRKEILAGHRGAVYARPLPTQTDDASHLLLADHADLGGTDPHYRWCIMGDLLGAWGITDVFETVEGNGALFGHYIVLRDIMVKFPDTEFGINSTIDLDPEGGTFFAYAKDRETGERFIDWIAGLINEARDKEGQTA